LTILSFGLAVLVPAWWVLSPTSVPRHGGRTAQEWLTELAEPDHARKQAALEALAAMGEASVPVLVGALEDRDSPAEALLLWLEGRMPALGSWVRPAAERQSAALEALERIGSAAALPALIRFLETSPRGSALDEERRAQAAVILGGLGGEATEAMPVLLAIVRADEGGGSVSARAALAAANEIGEPRPDLGLVLVESLRSGDERLRRLAAAGLESWGEEAVFAVESLREALWRPDAAAFTQVAMALGAMGGAAREAAPELIRGLSHDSSMVRAIAALNLARVRPQPALAVLPLAEVLRDEDAFVRSRAAWALGQFGAGAAGAVNDLCRALHDESEAVQIAVIEALGAIGPGAAGAVPDLERARGNRQAGLGRYVVAALGRIGASRLEPCGPTVRDHEGFND
jgi:HEAT repeat protein